ncbi:MAG: alanine dehydrogenase [Synergistaceae bacterium]|jgi:alanine dehydrogenase|nr:alanine dehydrogenase [Synergistaceae bacterium]
MKVGCVKEIKKNEFRAGMTPCNVRSYIQEGHQVYLERDAGVGSGFFTKEYEDAGAVILDSAEDVWNESDMIIKVEEPLEEEFKYFRKGLILYAYLHLAANRPLTDAMIESSMSGVAYETLTERNGTLPLLAPMSQIAGRLSIQEGAKYLEKPLGGLGVITPGVSGALRANVMILGGGVVGSNALKIAAGIGAKVSILDLNLDRLARLDDIYGNRIQTLYSSQAAIEETVSAADLVIGAVLIPGKATPKLIKRSYLYAMRPNSVIVDVAVNQGGCCETTKVTYHDNPTYVVCGVIHYCVGNMPGAVPRTSTVALTNATLSYGLQIADKGLKRACQDNLVIYSAVNTFGGVCTCRNVCVGFGLNHIQPEVIL